MSALPSSADKSQVRLARAPIHAIRRIVNDARDRTTAAYREWRDTLSADIKEHGIKSPLPVLRLPDGTLQLLAGGTRLEAAILAGQTEVPVLLRDCELSPTEALLEQVSENLMRRQWDSQELADLFTLLRELNGWTAAELARHVRVSQGQVSRDGRTAQFYLTSTLARSSLSVETMRTALEKMLCHVIAFDEALLRHGFGRLGS